MGQVVTILNYAYLFTLCNWIPFGFRYQPVSYKLESRSGSRDQFVNMVQRCNAVGVNVIVDLVINHMSGNDWAGQGTAGSEYNGYDQAYPAVPFSSLDFHQPYCLISDYGNAEDVRNCYLGTLNDLDHSKEYVRGKIVEYLSDLISIGVKGFRVDAAKHMWPGDLAAMQGQLEGDPFFFFEVIGGGEGEAISVNEYFNLGRQSDGIRNLYLGQ